MFFKDAISGNKLDMMHNKNNEQDLHRYTNNPNCFTDQNNIAIVYYKNRFLNDLIVFPLGGRDCHTWWESCCSFYSKMTYPPSAKKMAPALTEFWKIFFLFSNDISYHKLLLDLIVTLPTGSLEF